jgi:hypothetical protein
MNVGSKQQVVGVVARTTVLGFPHTGRQERSCPGTLTLQPFGCSDRSTETCPTFMWAAVAGSAPVRQSSVNLLDPYRTRSKHLLVSTDEKLEIFGDDLDCVADHPTISCCNWSTRPRTETGRDRGSSRARRSNSSRSRCGISVDSGWCCAVAASRKRFRLRTGCVNHIRKTGLI